MQAFRETRAKSRSVLVKCGGPRGTSQVSELAMYMFLITTYFHGWSTGALGRAMRNQMRVTDPGTLQRDSGRAAPTFPSETRA